MGGFAVSEEFSSRGRRLQPSAIRQMTKLAASAGPDLITLAGGMPNPTTFPLGALADIAAREIKDHQGRSLQYGMTTGFRPLVQWVCDYLRKMNMDCTPAEVICTTGSQQAIDLITEILIDPGDCIFVENPTYMGALAVFRKTGAGIVTVAQDSGGILLDDLEQKLQAAPAGVRKLIYIISNFQNPSGLSLASERRARLADMLEKWNAYLIEDDPYGEIYFGASNRPPLPVAHLNRGRVFYLGTFSKLVAPTFRTGWIATTKEMAYRLELAKEAADLCSSLLDQRILFQFCADPQFSTHLEHLRSFYAERCNAMLEALEREMPEGVTWTHPSGGFFVWVQLPAYLDSEEFLEEAVLKEKVSYVIGRPFTADDSARNFLRLAFSVEEPPRIHQGIQRLASIIRSRLKPQRH